MQVLPVSISNFQLGEGDGMCEWVSVGVKSEARLTIGNTGIGNIITLATLTTSHTPKRGPKSIVEVEVCSRSRTMEG